MANELDNILQDLYRLDPTLKEHESDLIKIINKIIASKPDAILDKEFATKLRAELLVKTGNQKSSFIDSLIKIFTIKKFAYATVGIIVTVVLMVPVVNYLNSPQTSQTDQIIIPTPAIRKAAPMLLDAGLNYGEATGLGAPSDRKEEMAAPQAVQMANPAAVHCEEQGGILEPVERNGGMDADCVFEDDSRCPQWEFFRDECDPNNKIE